MEMHQVRYFLAMARTLNFTRAAEDCHVSQPSLTRAVQKLEEEFGGALFRRERSRTHLTDLGRMMLPHLERTFEAAQAAKALARGMEKAEIAPLSLGVADSIDSPVLEEVLAEIGGSLPGFSLTVSSGPSQALMEAALSGELDLVIVEPPEDAPERLDSWQLFERAYHLVTRADHPLAGEATISMGALREEPWIDGGSDGSARLHALAGRHGFTPDIRHRVEGAGQLRRLIQAGLGSALMPPPRDRDRLAVVALEDAEAARPVVLAAIAGRRRSPAADSFVRASRARDWSEAAS